MTKTKNLLSWIAVTVFAGILSSCEDSELSDCKIIYSNDINKTTPGQTICFSLKENQTTPFLWKYNISDNNLVEFISDKYKVDKNSRGNEGAGGVHYFYFKTLAPGECLIDMRLEHVGTKDDFAQMKSYTIIIEE